jgi:HK97 family phage prohead protease
MEKMFFKTQLKDEYTFSGIANAAGNVDHHNDRTMPGAFTRTLREKGNRRKLLYQHDPSMPIGHVDLAEDLKGNLRVTEGRLVPGVAKAEEAYLLLKANVLDAMSIGYEVADASFDGNGVRLLKDVEIWEVSLVTFPANPEAIVERVKDNRPAIDALASWVRSMKETAEGEQLRMALRSIRVRV